jgi:hypothetical protein
MKRTTKVIGSAIVVGVGLLANKILKPDETSIVEKQMDGTYKLHSVPSNRLEPLEIVGADDLESHEFYHYDLDENTAYVSADDLDSEGDSV